jgi:hypothetical protein
VKWRKTWTIKERIKESRYNRKYETCMTEEIPEYLGKETSRERKMMARMRESWYWKEGEKRR